MGGDDLRRERRGGHRRRLIPLAVFFAALSGALFGALAVAVRHALRRGGDPYIGTAVVPGVASLAAVLLALPSLAANSVHASDLWPFALAGLLVPGASQLLFVIAVRDAGPSRTAILIGTAPLMSVAIALALLGEPFSLLLALGTALVVAAAVSLVAASLVTLAYVLLTRRRDLGARLRVTVVAFAPAGIALVLAYGCLFAAFDRGRVSVVAPLNATQSLWAVVLSVLIYGRQAELISRRLVLAGLLVVAGAAVVSAVR